MAGRQRTTFAKLQRERARQEKQAAKRARRQGLATEPEPTEQERSADDFFGPNGEIPDWLQDASSPSSSSSPSSPSSPSTPTPQNGSDAS